MNTILMSGSIEVSLSLRCGSASVAGVLSVHPAFVFNLGCQVKRSLSRMDMWLQNKGESAQRCP